MTSDERARPIGVFDSGVGGLSILRALRAQLPEEPIIYFGDQGHIPYGPRAQEQIRSFSEAITRWLRGKNAKLIVVACNTASAAALTYLRQTFPDTDFVGMEPAVKPAAEQTKTGVVGVLATPATFQGALFASVAERFAGGVELLKDTCPGLVQQIETGNLQGSETRRILESALEPMLKRNIDTVVLGCTHYPFVIDLIRDIAGPNVRVIDPAPAVARQAKRLLDQRSIAAPAGPRTTVQFYTSGDAAALSALLPRLIGETGPVTRLEWLGERALSEPPRVGTLPR